MKHKTPYDLHSTAIQIVDPGNAGTISVDKNLGVVQLVSAGTETRTLDRPTKPGVRLALFMKTDGGDITLTVTGNYNEAGDSTFVFDDVGEFAEFISLYDGTDYFWRLTASHSTGNLSQTEAAFLEGVTAGTAAASKALVLDSSLNIGTINQAQIDLVIGEQGAPTAETGVATVTIADILTGIVTITHATGSDVALTLDAGTAMDTGRPAGMGIDEYIDWTVINLSAAAADTATVTAASGHTVVGVMVVQSAHSTTGGIHGNAARFRSRRTAANTWITYRIG